MPFLLTLNETREKLWRVSSVVLRFVGLRLSPHGEGGIKRHFELFRLVSSFRSGYSDSHNLPPLDFRSHPPSLSGRHHTEKLLSPLSGHEIDF